MAITTYAIAETQMHQFLGRIVSHILETVLIIIAIIFGGQDILDFADLKPRCFSRHNGNSKSTLPPENMFLLQYNFYFQKIM